MAYDTTLADRIRAMGVRVVEVAGWRTRGSASFTPVGAIHHHTAGARVGATPSLNTCINGRPGLPGPLCQVMQSREPDFRDIAYVIAAGKANHGGNGRWRGISGNSQFHGLEVEHTGTGPVDKRRVEVSCRILAAMLLHPAGSLDAGWVCQHYEYAQPPGRKIDFFNLNPPFPNRGDGVRARVAQLLRPGPAPPPQPPPQEDDDVAYYSVYSAPNMQTRLVVDGAIVVAPSSELTETIAAYKKAGYKEHLVKFAEADDMSRWVHGHPTQAIEDDIT